VVRGCVNLLRRLGRTAEAETLERRAKPASSVPAANE
jgi:hypothetical protein